MISYDKPVSVAAVKDNDDDKIYLIPLYSESLDIVRLEQEGYTFAGWLAHPEQYQDDDLEVPEKTEDLQDYDDQDLDVWRGPIFTNCEHQVRDVPGDKGLCNAKIVLSYDGQAPSYCTEHEKEHQDEY